MLHAGHEMPSQVSSRVVCLHWNVKSVKVFVRDV